MAKTKRKSKTKKSLSEKFLHILVWVLFGIAAALMFFLGGYYVGYDNAKEELSHHLAKKEKERKRALDRLKKTIRQKEDLGKKLTKFLKQEQSKKYDITAAHETQDKKVLQPRKKQPLTHSTKKPEIALIFDDVSFPAQVRAIKSLGLKVTMSFFPPSAIHPSTPKLASKEKFYMIHLPMEAMHFHKEEPFTLRVNDSEATIEKRIRKIKKLFPRVHYINNHTGSKFTADKKAVKRLIRVLDKYDIRFIDSRTTVQTKVPEVMRELGRRYVARDVFLDHKGDIASIEKQLRLSIKIAKRDGLAVVIGHPHPNTILALAKNKRLFKNVKMVYVYELYR